jgi:hypothetical protein
MGSQMGDKASGNIADLLGIVAGFAAFLGVRKASKIASPIPRSNHSLQRKSNTGSSS